MNSNVFTQITSEQIINSNSAAVSSTSSSANALICSHQRHWRNERDLLLIIAEAMAELICTTDFNLVKNCEGPKCTLWFYDISKNHSRRWCTMSICGNRAKAALHRAKKKASNKSTLS